VSSVGSFFSYINDAWSHEPEVYYYILFYPPYMPLEYERGQSFTFLFLGGGE